MTEKIKLLKSGLNVGWLHWNLLAMPEVWNECTLRTEKEGSPHNGLDDIWVRYGKNEDALYDRVHISEWRESAHKLGLIQFVRDVCYDVGADVIGGVFITRIPAGKECKPHKDIAWHALTYNKYAVQIASAPGQVFHVEEQSLETKPGDLFTFVNQYEHWVTNPTPYDRITMIIAAK